jgi:hypothetical protein
MTLTLNPGVTVLQALRAQNDGTDTDTLALTATPGSGSATVRYYDAMTGGNEITPAITGSGWTTPALSPVQGGTGCRAPRGHTQGAMAHV